jgi:thiamine biosynthesis lipoprotein
MKFSTIDWNSAFELSVATSGDYQRSHTIDPRTGCPLGPDFAAVTVLHHECMRADAYATALMVLGPDAGSDFADRCGLAAMFTSRTATGMRQVLSAAFAQQLD